MGGTVLKKVDQDTLQKYLEAFVLYEIALHGIDPRETLFGTTFRREKDEGYKRTVYNKFHAYDNADSPLSYLDRVLKALPGGNLVDYHKKCSIEKQIETGGKKQLFEESLRYLYESNDDAASFERLADCFGYQFDILSFLFFLKDKDRYVPVRSWLFDQRFSLLGVKSRLSDNCSWENYQDVNRVMLEIRNHLCGFLQTDIDLLDAHSFFWILPDIETFISTGKLPKPKRQKQHTNTHPSSRQRNTPKDTSNDELKHEDEMNPDEYPHLPEGTVKEISITAFERSKNAVSACKKYYQKRDGKLVCQICGFDFGAFYGEEYEDMVHIHHVIPLAAIRENYEVNPVEDLLPVCPNCHMVLHRINKNKQRELTAEELKIRIEQIRSK